jgi:Fe-Mn family superoxide dismutase
MFITFIVLSIIAVCVQSQTELILTPLPYAYNEIEPVLSEHLMRLHHDKHFQGYTTKANAALKAIVADDKANQQLKDLAKQPIEFILTHLQHLPEQIHLVLRHNGGGYVNHKLFFSILQKPTLTAAENKPTGELLEEIEKSFKSFDKFKEMFTAASVNLFGSGWVWLYIDAQTKQLVLNFTANQDNP